MLYDFEEMPFVAWKMETVMRSKETNGKWKSDPLFVYMTDHDPAA